MKTEDSAISPCDDCLLVPLCRNLDFPTLIIQCELLKDYLKLFNGLQTRMADDNYPFRIISTHESLNPTTWVLTMKRTRRTQTANIIFILSSGDNDFYTSLYGVLRYKRTGKVQGLDIIVRIAPKKYCQTRNKINKCLTQKKEKGYRTYGAGNYSSYKRSLQRSKL